jgi:hypothetical protein
VAPFCVISLKDEGRHAVQPDDKTAPFLRVAIGRRIGWSLEGIIALLQNLS